ncbi:MAG: M23 family metallopeptidase, partial [Oscillospiraceae bacterium]|nr:M23 family metallopeptidase [Oscillospiraceae bacterium]
MFLFLFSLFVLHAVVSSMFASVSAYSSGMGIMEAETSWTGTDFFSWPLAIDGRITSGYGFRADPFTGEEKMHSGTDIAAASGTPVLAAAAGTVISADMTDSWGGGYGYH